MSRSADPTPPPPPDASSPNAGLMPGPALGPFELIAPVATGGMGVVWRARHLSPDGTVHPVAVKVLAASGAGDPAQRAAFKAEISAIAALDHPGVVTLYDAGLVPEGLAQIDPGLLPGSPWVAMEWADAGTLNQRRGRSHWEVQRWALRGVLEGLAHAHARGVLHRDLKPGNILLFGRDRRPKLTDFGLATLPWSQRRPAPGLRCPDQPQADPGAAHPRTAEGEEPVQWGTPAYMAPEQLQEREAEQGPWTDLYAVGCIAWALATGEPPFAGSVEETVAAQLYAPPPRFVPAWPVPSEYEGWLRRLLRKHPQDRYLRAADAAADLAVLGDALSPQARRYRPSARAVAPTLPRAERTLVPASAALPGPDPVEPSPVPPVPESWRPARPHTRATLPGVGEGLRALRALQVVERVALRDRLWAVLGEVARRGQSRCVVLVGEPDSGRGRLRGWLVERGHELGCTTRVDLTLPLECGSTPWQVRVAEVARDAAQGRPVTLSLDGDTPARELGALLEELHDPDAPAPILTLLRATPAEAAGELAQALGGRQDVLWLTLAPLEPEELHEALGEPLGLDLAQSEALHAASGGHWGRALALGLSAQDPPA